MHFYNLAKIQNALSHDHSVEAFYSTAAIIK